MKIRPSLLLPILFFLTSCAGVKIPDDAQMEDFFHVSAGNEISTSQWVIFLPGSSGLILDNDSSHYFDQAKEINKSNYSVILIDYQKAYKASDRKSKESTGEKINWVLEQAIQWATNRYDIEHKKFAVIGWSLAGEGLCLLANDQIKLDKLRINSIAMYYPSNQNEIVVRSDIPIMIQIGREDKITPLSQIENAYSKCPNTEIIVFDNSYHGFDIKSLNEAKTVRFPPLIGKKYIMKYNEESSNKSLENLILHLNKNS